MNITDEGIALLKRFEGFEAMPYQRDGKRPRIGYGHRIRDGEQFTTITLRQGEGLLRADAALDEEAVSAMLSVEVNPNQFSALVAFVFDVGAATFRESELRAFVNRKAWRLAADEFPKWVYRDGKSMPLLVERRAAERALFLKPVIVADNGRVNY